jgi:SAM-dependent methyltransferase
MFMGNYQNVSDEEWLNLLSSPVGDLPPLPLEDVQVRFCGRSGRLAMEQAMEFYKTIREACARFGKPLRSMHAVMEFGCGWGRITRCFLRDIPSGHLYGCDCMPEMVQYCNEKLPDYGFVLNTPLPPTIFRDGTFDLIYGYSVFSHLSEAAHMSWIKEFSRIMKPGGVLVLTTRPRGFINYWPKLPYLHDIDAGAYLQQYDSGNIAHIPACGGDNLSESFYGETAIPEAYIRREWAGMFKVEQFLDNVPHIDQKVIVVRRI